jgi:hypothetical protein
MKVQAALTLLCLLSVPGLAQSDEIAVTVDGERVALSGRAVRTPDGAVLVPLRGIFQKLGAAVQYSPATKAIVAVRGTTSVTLKLGELTGYINGAPYPLTTPAQMIDGTAMVPLRFLAQAFGAKVRYSPITRIASVMTGSATEPSVSRKPEPLTSIPAVAPPAPTIPGLVRGTITALGDDVTIKGTDGVQERLLLASEPVILVKSGKNPSVRRNLDALRVGDSVVVRLDGEGKALVVEAFVAGAAPPRVAAGERTNRPVVASLSKPTKLEIARLRHGLDGRWARAGMQIPFTLNGTPGAKATLILPEIPGRENVAMTEKSPGVYVASITVPAGLNAKEVHATGRLNFEEISSPEAPLEAPLSIDATAPTLSELSPAAGAALTELRPQFTGVYADLGSGIDVKKARLLIGGKDVTGDAVFTEGFFSYKPAAPLKPGTVDAMLLVRDGAGNELKKEWSITLQGASAEPIQSVMLSPSDRALDYGDVLTVKVVGVPGSQASFSLGEIVKDRLLREDSPGTYVGTYTIRRDDPVAGAQVSVILTTPAGKVATRTVSPFSGGAGSTPAAGYSPIIDTPQDGASVGDRVVLTGRALPGTTVRVTLKYNGKKLVIPTSGLVATLTLKSDEKGNWISQPVVIKVPRDVTGITLTAEVVALGAGGSVSAPAIVKFRR